MFGENRCLIHEILSSRLQPESRVPDLLKILVGFADLTDGPERRWILFPLLVARGVSKYHSQESVELDRLWRTGERSLSNHTFGLTARSFLTFVRHPLKLFTAASCLEGLLSVFYKI